jgi:hypothetical protein
MTGAHAAAVPPTKTIKSRRLMGPPQDEVHTLSARGALCITAILARYVGSGSKTAV